MTFGMHSPQSTFRFSVFYRYRHLTSAVILSSEPSNLSLECVPKMTAVHSLEVDDSCTFLALCILRNLLNATGQIKDGARAGDCCAHEKSFKADHVEIKMATESKYANQTANMMPLCRSKYIKKLCLFYK